MKKGALAEYWKPVDWEPPEGWLIAGSTFITRDVDEAACAGDDCLATTPYRVVVGSAENNGHPNGYMVFPFCSSHALWFLTGMLRSSWGT